MNNSREWFYKPSFFIRQAFINLEYMFTFSHLVFATPIKPVNTVLIRVFHFFISLIKFAINRTLAHTTIITFQAWAINIDYNMVPFLAIFYFFANFYYTTRVFMTKGHWKRLMHSISSPLLIIRCTNITGFVIYQDLIIFYGGNVFLVNFCLLFTCNNTVSHCIVHYLSTNSFH